MTSISTMKHGDCKPNQRRLTNTRRGTSCRELQEFPKHILRRFKRNNLARHNNAVASANISESIQKRFWEVISDCQPPISDPPKKITKLIFLCILTFLRKIGFTKFRGFVACSLIFKKNSQNGKISEFGGCGSDIGGELPDWKLNSMIFLSNPKPWEEPPQQKKTNRLDPSGWVVQVFLLIFLCFFALDNYRAWNSLYPPHGWNQNHGFSYWFEFPLSRALSEYCFACGSRTRFHLRG